MSDEDADTIIMLIVLLLIVSILVAIKNDADLSTWLLTLFIPVAIIGTFVWLPGLFFAGSTAVPAFFLYQNDNLLWIPFALAAATICLKFGCLARDR
jgi:hypothetical protein